MTERTAADEAETKRRKAQLSRLIRYLVRKGVIMREDHGGAVGVVWHAASRNVRTFETDQVERLIAGGFAFKSDRYRIVETDDGRPHWRAVLGRPVADC